MKSKAVLTIAFIALMITATITVLYAPSTPTGFTVTAEPQETEIGVDDTVFVHFTINQVTNLHGFQVSLQYNPAILEFQGISMANSLFSDQSFTNFSADTSTPGQVNDFIAVLTQEQGVSSNGGLLFRAEFQAVASGSSPITISELLLANSDAQPIAKNPVDSQITVSGEPTPPPPPPTVEILAPSNNQGITQETDFTALATSQASIQHVRFRLGVQEIGTVTSQSDNEFTLNYDTTQVSDAEYTLRATARDSFDQESHAEITVRVDNTGPTVTVTSPSAGEVSDTVTVTATASDPSGVQSVRFLLNGDPLSPEITSGPYTFEWDTTSVASGTYNLAARATDTLGNQRISAPVQVTIAEQEVTDTEPPTVTITNPASGAEVSNTITLSVTATDNVGVARVHFLINGESLANRTEAPYTVQWNSNTVENGEHTLTARATDLAQNSAEDEITFTVNNVADTTPPSVTITNPTAGSTLTSGTQLTLTVAIEDDGDIESVQWRIGSQNLGSPVTSSPYSRTWTPSGTGQQTITARATDAAGNVGEDSITVTLQAPPSIPPPSFGGGGGGGGGGAAPPPTTTPEPETPAEETTTGPSTLLINYAGEGDELVSRVTLQVRSDNEDGRVTSAYDTDFSNTPEGFVGLQRILFDLEGFSFADVSQATVVLHVPQQWLGEQGLSANEVEVLLLDQGTYRALPVSIQQETADVARIQTVSNQLGVLAVGVRHDAESQATTQDTTTQPQVQEPTPTRRTPWRTIAIIVQLVGALVLIIWGYTKIHGTGPATPPTLK